MASKAEEMEIKRKHLMCCAAKLFLQKGYSDTSIRELAKTADVPTSAFYQSFGDKEGLLYELVKYVLHRQFDVASELVKDYPEDKILYYAVETTLQLYLTESGENIRDLYATAYSSTKTTELIQSTITDKLEYVFKEQLPEYEKKDFYKKEIASGGIMRGFMTIPCDMWFTMERKVAAFLENTFLLYHVPQEKIRQAIEFVSQFDYPTIARNMIDSMLRELEEMTA